MISSFTDATTEDIWNGVNSKAARRIPQALWPVIRRKLDQIDSVVNLDALRVPPGNRLHGGKRYPRGRAVVQRGVHVLARNCDGPVE